MKKIETKLEDIFTTDQETTKQTEFALADFTYDAENKHHRNRIARLDHFFEYVTHEICLFVFSIAFGVLILIVRFVAAGSAEQGIKRLSDDLWTVFTFLSGALIAYLLTKVLDKKKTEQQQQEN
jgi:hypothetical protein